MGDKGQYQQKSSLWSAQWRFVHDGQHGRDHHRPDSSGDLERDGEGDEEPAGERHLFVLPDVRGSDDGGYGSCVGMPHGEEYEKPLLKGNFWRRCQAKKGRFRKKPGSQGEDYQEVDLRDGF